MREKIAAFLDNDSPFGRAMGRCGVLIAANILFLIFSFPVLTVGPALIALFTVTLKMLRGRPDLNPFAEYWRAFKGNFKQGMAISLIALMIVFVTIADVRFLVDAEGILVYFKYMVYFAAGLALILFVHLIPVTAAFADTLPNLMRNAFYFAAKNPARAAAAAAVFVGPMIFTYVDLQRLPLYAFIWVTCGFSLTALAISKLLIKDFNRFLPEIEPDPDPDM